MGNCNNCMDEKPSGEVGIQSFAPAAKQKPQSEKPVTQDTFSPDFMPQPYESDDFAQGGKTKQSTSQHEYRAEAKGDIFEEKPTSSNAHNGSPEASGQMEFRGTAQFPVSSVPPRDQIITLQSVFRAVSSKRRALEQEARLTTMEEPGSSVSESFSQTLVQPTSLLSDAAKVTLTGLPPYKYQNSIKGARAAGPRSLADGSIYVGQWSSSGARTYRFGKGKLYKADGSYYEGYWCGPKMQPSGRIIYPNGDYYEGGLLDGQRHGVGLFRSHNRSEYRGTWANDLKHGKGTESQADGSKYDGDFARGVRSGQGVLEFGDQKRYQGGFENGEFSGLGVHTWKDGRRYEGGWLNGKMHGEGTFLYADGKRYKGAYSHDHKHGYGVYEWDGNLYEGEWRDGKMHGLGYMTTKEKGRRRYEFRAGEKVREVKE